MKIKRVRIINFRNLKNVDVTFSDYNVFVGANRLGKTSIIDSVMWVLTGETLVYGKTDSDNRDKNDSRNVVNVILELDNGTILERKYQDIWKEDLDGNLRYSKTENKFYINNAEYGKKEFYERIKSEVGCTSNVLSQIQDFNILRFLTDYNYFGTIDYKVARKFLEQILGLQSDNDLISETKFMPIAQDMISQKFEINKVINAYKNQIKFIDEKIKEYETYLRDCERKLQGLKNNDDDSQTLEQLENKKREMYQTSIHEDERYVELEKKINETTKAIHDCEKDILNQIYDTNEKINALLVEGRELQDKISTYKSSKERLENVIEYREKNLDMEKGKLSEYEKQDLSTYEKKCENCGHVLNSEQAKEEFEKHNDFVNRYKAYINSLQEELDNYTKQLNELEPVDDLVAKFENNEKVYNELSEKLDQLNAQKNNNQEVSKLIDQVDELELEKNKLLYDLQIERNNNINEISHAIQNKKDLVSIQEDINNLKNNIKIIKGDKSQIEIKTLLVKQFKKLKMDMIEKATVKVFPTVEIKILETNENTDTIKETCYAKLKGVEFKGINDGYKYLLGIQIIEDVKKHLGLQDMPIIFDKFGDIDTNTFEQIKQITNAQIITTKVSDSNNINYNFTNKGENE